MSRRLILERNLTRVRAEIAAACDAAHRSPDSVTLVVVTKYVGPEILRDLVDLGVRDIGENRPQALVEKAEALRDRPVRWHLIGHLQRNKVRRVLPFVHLLHAGDSLRLLQAVAAAAQELQQSVEVLLEINLSGEATKHGWTFDALRAAVPALLQLPHLQFRGLMGMSGLDASRELKAAQFQKLVSFRDQLRIEFPEIGPLEMVSAGMSDDFDLAIAAGSTLVRIGSAIFQGILPE